MSKRIFGKIGFRTVTLLVPVLFLCSPTQAGPKEDCEQTFLTGLLKHVEASDDTLNFKTEANPPCPRYYDEFRKELSTGKLTQPSIKARLAALKHAKEIRELELRAIERKLGCDRRFNPIVDLRETEGARKVLESPECQASDEMDALLLRRKNLMSEKARYKNIESPANGASSHGFLEHLANLDKQIEVIDQKIEEIHQSKHDYDHL